MVRVFLLMKCLSRPYIRDEGTQRVHHSRQIPSILCVALSIFLLCDPLISSQPKIAYMSNPVSGTSSTGRLVSKRFLILARWPFKKGGADGLFSRAVNNAAIASADTQSTPPFDRVSAHCDGRRFGELIT